jgi:hypothetical protein
MRRLGPPLLGIGAVGLFMLLVSGAETGSGVGIAGMALFAGVVWLVARWIDRRRAALDGRWTPVADVAFEPAAAHTAASPVGVAMSLSRVEARELLASTSFGAGLGFCLLLLVLVGKVWAPDYGGDLPGTLEQFPMFVHPLAGLVVLAAHRARTRSTRDGTQELFDSLPASQSTRTTGHLLTAWVPAVVMVTFLTVLVTLISRAPRPSFGEVGARQVALLLGAAVLGVGATALGVALARWAPWTLVPVVAVIGVGVASVQLATSGDRTTEPIRQLSTWLGEPQVDLRLTAPHWVAHQLWITALVAVVAVLGLLRDRREPRLVGIGVAAVTVAGLSAVVATRPIDAADADRIAALIDDRAAHQQCVDAAGLPVCTYPGDDELARHLAAEVASVVAAAPVGALDGWAWRHGTPVERSELDPEVLERLRPDEATPGERLIPMEIVSHPQADEGARFWTALTAVGVTGSQPSGTTVSLAGQARGVMALWLATRGADADTVVAMTSVDSDAGRASASGARPWPNTCVAGPVAAVWGLTDLEAARRLIAAPEAEVRHALWSGWRRFTDPSTSTAELLDALGLEPVAPVRGSTPSGEPC